MSRGSQRLLIYLLKKGVTQGAFAARCGISRTYMNLILNEKKKPGRVTIEVIDKQTRGYVAAAHWLRPALRRRWIRGRKC